MSLETELKVIREKWQTENSTLQREASHQLVQLVLRGGTPNNNAAYTLLKTKGILHQSPSVYEPCFEGPLLFVKSNFYQRKNAVNDILNTTTILSASALDTAVKSIIDLLCFIPFHDKQQDKASKDAYPPHNPCKAEFSVNPLLQVVMNRPNDAWLPLMSHVTRKLTSELEPSSSTDTLSTWLKIFWPALSYIISGTATRTHVFGRSFVHSQLTGVVRHPSLSKDVKLLLFKLLEQQIPLQNIKSGDLFAFTYSSCKEMIELHELLHLDPTELSLYIMQLCFELFVSGRPIHPLLSLLQRLTLSNTSFLVPATPLQPPLVFAGLLALLPHETELGQTIILQILSKGVAIVGGLCTSKRADTDPNYLYLLSSAIFPLLQQAASPYSYVKSTSSQLLLQIDSHLSTLLPLISLPTQLHNVHQQFLTTCSLRGPFLLFIRSYQLSHNTFLSSPESSVAWLRSLANRISSLRPLPSPITPSTTTPAGKEKESKPKNKKEEQWDHTLYALAPFLTHPHADVRAEAARLLPALAQAAPLRTLATASLCAFRLARESDATVLLEIAYALAGLAVRKPCVGPILRALSPLLQTPELSATSIRVLTKMWTLQDRVFPKLRTMVMAWKPESDIETKTAIASCVLDVSKTKPNRGEELLQPLSHMLAQETQPMPLSIAMQALSALCEGAGIDYFNGWRIFRKNPLLADVMKLDSAYDQAVESVALYLGRGAAESKTANDTKLDILKKTISLLWQLVNHSSAVVRRGAFTSLIAYANAATLTELSEEGYAPNYLTFVETEVSQNGESEALQAATDLAHTVLQIELKERRGLRSKQRMHAGNPDKDFAALDEVLAAANKPLVEDYQLGKRPGLRGDVAGGLLWSSEFEANTDSNNVTQTLRKFLTQLQQLTNDVEARNWVNLPISFAGWYRFVSSALRVPRDGLDDTLGQIEGVLAGLKDGPTQSTNSVFGLAVLASILPSSSYERTTKIMDDTMLILKPQTKESTPIGTSDFTKGAAAISLGFLASHSLRPTDETRFARIIEVLLDKLVTDQAEAEWVKFAAGCGLGLLCGGIDTKLEGDPRILVLQRTGIIARLKAFIEVAMSSPKTPLAVLGALLGIGYAAPILGGNNDQTVEIYRFVSDIIYKNLPDIFALPKMDSFNSHLVSGALLAIPPLASVAYGTGAIPAVDIERLLGHVVGLAENLVQCADEKIQQYQNYVVSTIFASGSSLIHALLVSKFPFPNKYVAKYFETTSTQALQSPIPFVRIGGIMGFGNILGCSLIVPSVPSTVFPSQPTLSNAFIKHYMDSHSAGVKFMKTALLEASQRVQQLFLQDSDNRVCRMAAWVLGALNTPFGGEGATGGKGFDLTSLPDTSLIRSLLSHLLVLKDKSGKSLSTVLQILEDCQVERLPILQWSTVLKNLFHAGLGEDVRVGAIQFANVLLESGKLDAGNSSTDSNTGNISIVNLLLDFTAPNYFERISEDLKATLLDSIPQLLKHVATYKADELLNVVIKPIFVNKAYKNYVHAYEVVQECLQAKDLSTDIQTLLQNLILDTLSALPSPVSKHDYTLSVEKLEIIRSASKCISNMPTTQQQRLTTLLDYKNQQQNLPSMEVAVCLAVFLVQENYLPLSVLHRSRTRLLQYGSDANEKTLTEKQSTVLLLIPILLSPLPTHKDTNWTQWLNDTLDEVTMFTSPSSFPLLPTLGAEVVGQLCLLWSGIKPDEEALVSQRHLHLFASASSWTVWLGSAASLLPYTLPIIHAKESENAALKKIISLIHKNFINVASTSPPHVHASCTAAVAECERVI